VAGKWRSGSRPTCSRFLNSAYAGTRLLTVCRPALTHKLNRAGRGEQGPTDPKPPNGTASCRPSARSGLPAANGNYCTFGGFLPVGPVPGKLPPSAIWPRLLGLSRNQCLETRGEQGETPDSAGLGTQNCRDRSAAHGALGSGGLPTAFAVVLSRRLPWLMAPQAPLRSRTVGCRDRSAAHAL
jgi:hypothetical protein